MLTQLTFILVFLWDWDLNSVNIYDMSSLCLEILIDAKDNRIKSPVFVFKKLQVKLSKVEIIMFSEVSKHHSGVQEHKKWPWNISKQG
jgi:hypothetical protein